MERGKARRVAISQDRERMAPWLRKVRGAIVILACDVETSGLIPKGAVPGSAQFPWPVQIGAVLFDFDGHDRASFGSRIRADGRTVSAGAAQVHGISSRDAGRSGVPEIIGLGIICAFAAEAKYLTGFNVDFDRAILESALIRLGKETKKLMRPGLQAIDLMRPAAAFCKLPSEREDGAYKFPRLDDALLLIRNERPRQARHDALRDAYAAKRLFLSLRSRGALEMEEAA
jgi:DNA polymerase III epsilon subunit-like protein